MRVFLIILQFLFFSAGWANATEMPVKLSMITGRYGGVGIAYFGLKVNMDKGWHTYWKTPGEGGLPAEVKVTRAENVKGLQLLWPAPDLVRTITGNSTGYQGQVVFPIAIMAADPSKPVDISLSVTVYACSNICVPFRGELAGYSLPGASGSIADAALIEQWLTKIPMNMADAGALPATFDAKTGRLTVDAGMLDLANNSPAFLDSGLEFAAAPAYADDDKMIELTIEPVGSRNLADFKSALLVITDKAGPGAYTLDIRPSIAGALTLPILAAAFLGGLILNLMPCVLPVLSLKLLSFTKEARHVRRSFFWSALGIWLSFLALGLVLLAMKLFGLSVGWGLQFQSPLFLTAMAVVTMIFALSMVDGVILYLPGRMNGWLVRMTDGESNMAALFQGFVATLLATPCSAPFVGTAIGFALGSTPLQLISIFVLMGFGMALPYLLIAVLPGIGRLVPRPGRWMTTFKVLLASLLAAMSGYLVVLISATSSETRAIIIGSLVALPMLLVRKKSSILLLVAFVTSILVLGFMSKPRNSGPWKPFEPVRIEQLVKSGKTVVVDITAKWCITCHVNEETVLSQPEIIAALSEPDVVAMRGDWTKPNEAISAYLKTFNRYGIPFNIVYSPTHPQGVVLPELLAKKDILDALRK